MAFPDGTQGQTNGTTEVTVIGTPPSGFRRLIPKDAISIYNADTVTRTFQLQKVAASGTFVIEEVAVTTKDSAFNRSKIFLDANESLEIVLTAIPTTESDWVASFYEQEITLT